jgi:hypothetical protein
MHVSRIDSKATGQEIQGILNKCRHGKIQAYIETRVLQNNRSEE